MSKKSKFKLTKTNYNLLIIAILLFGLNIMLYPTFSDMWNKKVNASIISQYNDAISTLSQTDYSSIWEAAYDYNQQHTLNTFHDAFDGEEYVLSHPYDGLLNPTGNLVMGYLSIPKISVSLAIYHGTSSMVLEEGVGHIEGTSLPVGGKSSHCVLSAHTGLPGAKLFTDLDQLVEGDKFFIYILNETLAYEVDQITIITPDEFDELVIFENQDYVTLLTCTPYGVNSHRLLVRGHRIPYIDTDVQEQISQHQISDRDKPILVLAGGIILLIIILLIMTIHNALKKRKKKQLA